MIAEFLSSNLFKSKIVKLFLIVIFDIKWKLYLTYLQKHLDVRVTSFQCKWLNKIWSCPCMRLIITQTKSKISLFFFYLFVLCACVRLLILFFSNRDWKRKNNQWYIVSKMLKNSILKVNVQLRYKLQPVHLKLTFRFIL